MRRTTRNRDRSWGAPLLAIMIVVTIVVVGSGVLPAWNFGHSRESMLVTTDDVNLRLGPGTSYDVITVVDAGTDVALLEVEDSFASVRVNGRHGWISLDYLAEPDTVGYQPPAVAAAEQQIPTAVPTQEPTAVTVIAQEVQVQRDPQPGEQWIEVDRSTRTVTLHDGEIIVAQFSGLIGKDPSPDGYYSTAVGTYRVWVKEKALTETPFAEGVYLTDFVGFDPDRHNGFHSPTRDAEGNIVVTGGTQTLGCVRLGEADAQFLFEFAYIGMRVEIHD